MARVFNSYLTLFIFKEVSLVFKRWRSLQSLPYFVFQTNIFFLLALFVYVESFAVLQR